MNDSASVLNRHFYIFVLLAAAFFYYAALYVVDVHMDVQKHVDFAAEIIRGTNFPPTFLYFLAVCAVALFRDDYGSLLFGSLVVLSFAVALKFFVTVRLFARESDLRAVFGENKALAISNAVGVCLITAFCIYLPKELNLTTHFYIGQMPPNIWANSTTIFLMPFAILLFWHSYKLLGEFKMRDFWFSTLMIVLNIVTKPNFFLCFVAVFPLLALFRYRLKKEFWLCLIPPAFGFVLMILEYVAIYQLGAYGYGKPGESGVTIAPLVWWRLFAPNIPVSILISTAFPLVYLAFYFDRVKTSVFLQYAYLLTIAGFTILALFGETGERAEHGNFQWQAVVANYILFFAVTTDFARGWAERKGFDLKDKIIALVFLLHVFSGWLYLAKTLWRGNYG